jgi:hypothetical protein
LRGEGLREDVARDGGLSLSGGGTGGVLAREAACGSDCDGSDVGVA